MGFHIRMVGYLFGIPVLLLWKAAPNSVQVVVVFYPILLHIKPINAAASRASSSRLKQLIMLAESVSFRRNELAVKLGLWSTQVPFSRSFKFNGYKKVAAGFGP